jgi:RNA polymerase sigma factor (sigma-70 family)
LVNEEVNELNPRDRMIYELHYVQGIGYEEIAAMLNIPLNSVKVYFFRLHKRIRQKLGKYYKDK